METFWVWSFLFAEKSLVFSIYIFPLFLSSRFIKKICNVNNIIYTGNDTNKNVKIQILYTQKKGLKGI